MPNKDKTGPDGKSRPGKGLGPCSSRRGTKEAPSNDGDFSGDLNRKRRGKR